MIKDFRPYLMYRLPIISLQSASPPRTEGLHFVLKSNIEPLPGLVARGCRKTSCLLGSRASRVQGERGFGSGFVKGGRRGGASWWSPLRVLGDLAAVAALLVH